MRYEINAKNDLLTGATLIVEIPEEEIDKKALYTILADRPDFVLPFHYRTIDGKIEITYHIGQSNKLEHLAGSRSPKEYALLWSGLMNPLLCCEDWFMKPYSFVLAAQFLYYDKKNKTLSYVYIPTINDCSNQSDLIGMAAEVSKMFSVPDAALENKVLKTIMQDFDPQSFKEMLDAYATAEETENNTPAAVEASDSPQPANDHSPHQSPGDEVSARPPECSKGDIIIDIPKKKSSAKESKKTPKSNEISAEKGKEKDTKNRGSFSSLFSRKKDDQQEAVMEAAPRPPPVACTPWLLTPET